MVGLLKSLALYQEASCWSKGSCHVQFGLTIPSGEASKHEYGPALSHDGPLACSSVEVKLSVRLVLSTDIEGTRLVEDID